MVYTIFCAVLGVGRHDAFPIPMDQAQTVGELEIKIREEKHLTLVRISS